MLHSFLLIGRIGRGYFGVFFTFLSDTLATFNSQTKQYCLLGATMVFSAIFIFIEKIFKEKWVTAPKFVALATLFFCLFFTFFTYFAMHLGVGSASLSKILWVRIISLSPVNLKHVWRAVCTSSDSRRYFFHRKLIETSKSNYLLYT